GTKYNTIAGIEFFPNLEKLKVKEHNIAAVDVSKNTKLKELEINNNKLTVLDVTKNTDLEQLRAGDNQLTSLDLSNNSKLKVIAVQTNKLATLTMGAMPDLETLECGSNQLTTIDLRPYPKLLQFVAYNNKLTAFDVSQNLQLKNLSINDNCITGVFDITANKALEKFECGGGANNLTAILMGTTPGYYPDLDKFQCHENSIEELNIRGTNIGDNSTELWIHQNGMKKLYCADGFDYTDTGKHTFGNPALVVIDAAAP
ncbi:MAG: hypothetical protein FWE80_02455, partial [Oscillospiraceae bacterium]|nr:hypothetical protein [Oscillospiraceae bacterium]